MWTFRGVGVIIGYVCDSGGLRVEDGEENAPWVATLKRFTNCARVKWESDDTEYNYNIGLQGFFVLDFEPNCFEHSRVVRVSNARVGQRVYKGPDWYAFSHMHPMWRLGEGTTGVITELVALDGSRISNCARVQWRHEDGSPSCDQEYAYNIGYANMVSC